MYNNVLTYNHCCILLSVNFTPLILCSYSKQVLYFGSEPYHACYAWVLGLAITKKEIVSMLPNQHAILLDILICLFRKTTI